MKQFTFLLLLLLLFSAVFNIFAERMCNIVQFASAINMCEPVTVSNTLFEQILDNIYVQLLLFVIIRGLSMCCWKENQDLKLGFKSKHVDSMVTKSQIIHNKSHLELFIFQKNSIQLIFTETRQLPVSIGFRRKFVSCSHEFLWFFSCVCVCVYAALTKKVCIFNLIWLFFCINELKYDKKIDYVGST